MLRQAILSASNSKRVWRLARWGATGAGCILVVFGVGSAVVQNRPQATTSSPPAALLSTTAAEAPPPAHSFSAAVDEVLRLLDSGVGLDVVQSYIHNSVAPYDLGSDDIVALNQRKVPADVVVAMLHRTRELAASDAQQSSSPLSPLNPNGFIPYPAVPPDYAGANPQPPYPTVPVDYPEQPIAYGYPAPASPAYGTAVVAPVLGYSVYTAHAIGYSPVRGANTVHPAAQAPVRWPDAYPNHLVTGPNWGADRGFTPRVGGRWPDAYPNRVVTGPFWGANIGSTGRSATPAARSGGLPVRSTPTVTVGGRRG